MKKLTLLILVVISLCSCSYKDSFNSNIKYDFVVNGWNTIEHKGNVYTRTDKYNRQFNDYIIFYDTNYEVEKALYRGNNNIVEEVELRTYKNDKEINFISQVPHSYDLFEPSVYGNSNNQRFKYFDDFNNVDKMSLVVASSDSTTCQNGEYLLPKEIASEIWCTLSEMENNTNISNSTWKKTYLEICIYLYIKDVNAAVYVGSLCYNTKDELCVSNTNYSKLYPLSSQWQNLNVLFENCEYVEHSLLNNY